MKWSKLRGNARPRPLTDAEAEQILAMVQATALQFAPEEYEDAFADYAYSLRSTRVVPGTSASDGDGSAAGIADAAIFIGIGLVLLGQLATHVVSVATDMAIEKGVSDAVVFVKKLIHGKDHAAVEAMAARVVAEADPPAEADPVVLTQVVLIQIQVFGGVPAEDLGSPPDLG